MKHSKLNFNSFIRHKYLREGFKEGFKMGLKEYHNNMDIDAESYHTRYQEDRQKAVPVCPDSAGRDIRTGDDIYVPNPQDGQEMIAKVGMILRDKNKGFIVRVSSIEGPDFYVSNEDVLKKTQQGVGNRLRRR